MKSKYLLFIGIFLLVIGILIRTITQIDTLGLILIITGVLCKLIYIINRVRLGDYRPGKELIVLAMGLLLFFIGLYSSDTVSNFIKPIYFIVLGVILKIIFVFRFIQIMRFDKK